MLVIPSPSIQPAGREAPASPRFCAPHLRTLSRRPLRTRPRTGKDHGFSKVEMRSTGLPSPSPSRLVEGRNDLSRVRHEHLSPPLSLTQPPASPDSACHTDQHHGFSKVEMRPTGLPTLSPHGWPKVETTSAGCDKKKQHQQRSSYLSIPPLPRSPF